MRKYYFVVASEKFLLFQEPIEEILRERTNYYDSFSKPIDFWLLKDSELSNYPEILKIKETLKVPVAAIISTNESFITWLKLRCSFVAVGTLKYKIVE